METMLFSGTSQHSEMFSESCFISGRTRTEIVIIAIVMRAILFTSFIRKSSAQLNYLPLQKTKYSSSRNRKGRSSHPLLPLSHPHEQD